MSTVPVTDRPDWASRRPGTRLSQKQLNYLRWFARVHRVDLDARVAARQHCLVNELTQAEATDWISVLNSEVQ